MAKDPQTPIDEEMQRAERDADAHEHGGLRDEQQPQNEVGHKADYRIATLGGAVLNRLQQETVAPVGRQLQIGADRRFQIGHDAAPDNLGFALVVAMRELVEPIPGHDDN